MRSTPLVAFGLAVVLLCGAEAASAYLAANTIDERATYEKRVGLFHRTADNVTNRILNWLDHHGLGPGP